MSNIEQNDQGQLQHDAEHERPRKRNPVLFYLVILFAAAFLLLLLAYFSQQRANQTALNDLTLSSNSAVQTLDQILAERDALKEQTAALEEQIAGLEAQITQVQVEAVEARSRLEEAGGIMRAMSSLNHVRALYNQHQNAAARAYLAELPQREGVDETEYFLQLYVSRLPAGSELLEAYNPLEAWRQLKAWLG